MYDNTSELYNEYLSIYFDQYTALSNAAKGKLGNNYDPDNLFLETYNYDAWFENEESIDTKKLMKNLPIYRQCQR